MSHIRFHILLTGAGGSIAVNLARSLQMAPRGELRLFGCDASLFNIHLAPPKDKAVIPPFRNETEYLSAIQRLVDRWHIHLIIPTNVGEILLLKKHEKEIKAHLFVPSLTAIETGADKWATYELLKKAGLPVPRTMLIKDQKDIDVAFAEYGDTVWIRGCGVPGRGIGVASLPAKTKQQAVGWIDFYQGWGAMMAAEFLPGDNLTWMGLWKNGELVASQGRKRISYVIPHVSPSGITGAPAVSCTVNDDRINEAGTKAMLALDPHYNGVGFVDFKGDPKGNPLITEINVGRFGTTHHFYTVAGANFPYWYVQLAMGEMPTDVQKYNALPAGMYWIRSLDAGPVLVMEQHLNDFQLKL